MKKEFLLIMYYGIFVCVVGTLIIGSVIMVFGSFFLPIHLALQIILSAMCLNIVIFTANTLVHLDDDDMIDDFLEDLADRRIEKRGNK